MTSGLEQALEEAQASVVAKVRKPRKPRAPKAGLTIEPDASDEAPELTAADLEDAIVTEPGESLIESVEKARKTKKEKTVKTKSKTKSKTKAKASKKAPSKIKSPKKRTATPAQLKAAKNKQGRRDWVKVIQRFRTAQQKNLVEEMGTPGSAQVTKARLDGWDGFKGLTCFTKGSKLFITKLTKGDAIAAAKKAGKW